MIDKPGVYDISAEEYHSDCVVEPSLSSSIAKLIVDRSPWHAWWCHPRLNPAHEAKQQDNFDIGSAFHTMMLGKGAEIAVLDFDDWRSKDAKEARKQYRAEGVIPMLRAQFQKTSAMVEGVRRQIEQHDEARDALKAGTPERTLIWREDNGVWCRARLDWMPHFGLAYPDLKTTAAAASPDQWGRKVMFDTGCDIQDAFYRRGLKKLGINEHAFLLFVVAEVDEPHAMATHRLSPGAAAMADRKVEHAIRLFGMCQERNWWPGYRHETAWHDPPPWHEQRWIEREDSGGCDAALAQLAAWGGRERTAEDHQAFEDADERDAFGLQPIKEGITK